MVNVGMTKDVILFLLGIAKNNRCNDLVTHSEKIAINLTVLIKFVLDTPGGPTNI